MSFVNILTYLRITYVLHLTMNASFQFILKTMYKIKCRYFLILAICLTVFKIYSFWLGFYISPYITFTLGQSHSSPIRSLWWSHFHWLAQLHMYADLTRHGPTTQRQQAWQHTKSYHGTTIHTRSTHIKK